MRLYASFSTHIFDFVVFFFIFDFVVGFRFSLVENLERFMVRFNSIQYAIKTMEEKCKTRPAPHTNTNEMNDCTVRKQPCKIRIKKEKKTKPMKNRKSVKWHAH